MTRDFIPQADPGLQYRRQKDEIDQAVARVLESGRYVLGSEVETFERDFAAACGAGFAVGVASGTDAIRLALMGVGVGRGDQVIVPAHTAVATIAAVEAVPAVPVLVDIDPESYTIDPQAVAAAITQRTKAIVPVHLYGHPADMHALREIADRHGVAVIEDCAQAHGAMWRGSPVGSLATVGCFSFYPTKNLGAIGDGGAIVTNDEDVAQRVRMLREYGWRTRHVSEIRGSNSRLDEIQAAILRVKLGVLEPDAAERRRLAQILQEGLSESVRVPTTGDGATHAFHLFVIECDRRDELREALRGRGVGTGLHYPQPIHSQPAYQNRLGRPGQFPVAERACARVLSLPLYPGLTDDRAQRVVAVVNQAVKGVR